MTGTHGRSRPRSVDLLPSTRQTIPEAIGKNIAIASKESFGGWTKTFTDPRLCAAIVDRLTFGGTIIETGADSHPLAQSKELRG